MEFSRERSNLWPAVGCNKLIIERELVTIAQEEKNNGLPFVSDVEIREHVSKLVFENQHTSEKTGTHSNITHIDFSLKNQSAHDAFY